MLVGDGRPPVAEPVMQVSNGAAIWRREVVPAGARRLTLWVQSLSTSGSQLVHGSTARVSVSTEPGAATVLANVEPSVGCKVDGFTFCQPVDGGELRRDCTRSRGGPSSRSQLHDAVVLRPGARRVSGGRASLRELTAGAEV